MTFEMSNDEQMERLATLWGKVPYYALRDKSLLTDVHEQSLGRMLNVRDQLHPLYGVEDTMGHSTVGAVMALAKETEAAVVCIDGIYLMTDERTGQIGFEGHGPLSNISRDLKRLAKTQKIAVIATTQSLFSKTRGGKTNLGGMGYTSAFSQDADVIVGVELPLEDDADPNMTTMRVLGNRTGIQNISFEVEWDLDTGLIEELGEDYSTPNSGAGNAINP
jgi:replicative DNA helicase